MNPTPFLFPRSLISLSWSQPSTNGEASDEEGRCSISVSEISGHRDRERVAARRNETIKRDSRLLSCAAGYLISVLAAS